jgi:hypothetical protein
LQYLWMKSAVRINFSALLLVCLLFLINFSLVLHFLLTLFIETLPCTLLSTLYCRASSTSHCTLVLFVTHGNLPLCFYTRRRLAFFSVITFSLSNF